MSCGFCLDDPTRPPHPRTISDLVAQVKAMKKVLDGEMDALPMFLQQEGAGDQADEEDMDDESREDDPVEYRD